MFAQSRTRFSLEGITVNAIFPVFVATPLISPGTLAVMPAEHLTPLSTIMNAYDCSLNDDAMTRHVVEASQTDPFFRKPIDYQYESEEWLTEDLGDKEKREEKQGVVSSAH